MSFDLFKASVPGQSLTQEVGSAPYEMPPQYVNVDDALEYLFEKLTEPRQITRLVLMLKKDMPVEYIARAILFQGFQQNRWTPDMALLMLRIVMAIIIAIGVQKGIKPTIFNPDKSQQEFLDQFLDMAPDDMPDAAQEAGVELPMKFTGLLGANL